MRLIIIGQCTGPDDSQSSSPEEGIPISRSMAGDKGRYFLLEAKRDGNIVKTLHMRIGVNSVGHTKTEVNRAKDLMCEIGYSDKMCGRHLLDVPGSTLIDTFAIVELVLA